MTGFDPERLLAILLDEGVEFVIVGGYAALLHGASRPTEDVDVTPATTAQNLTCLTRALKRLRARIRTDDVPDGLPFDTSAEAMRGVLMLNLTTEFGDLDITFQPSGTAGYDDLIVNAEQRDVAGLADPRSGTRRHRPIQRGCRARQGHPSTHRATRASTPERPGQAVRRTEPRGPSRRYVDDKDGRTSP